MRTAAQIEKEYAAEAKALTVEVKRRFWRAMTEDNLTVGEARKIDGLDLMVAAQLVIQCHTIMSIPMKAEDIE